MDNKIAISDYTQQLVLNVRGTEMKLSLVIARKFPCFDIIQAQKPDETSKVAQVSHQNIVLFDDESKVVFVNAPLDFFTLIVDFFMNDRDPIFVAKNLKEKGYKYTQTIKMCNDLGLCSDTLGITQPEFKDSYHFLPIPAGYAR
jgi:hypothetical protein